MLTHAQEKLIRSLHRKKGRDQSGLCLVEGRKVVQTAGSAVEFTFSKKDSKSFADLVTTETAQDLAGVARIPQWSDDDLQGKPLMLVLDGVQDPGNVGTILRLCLAFDAALLLVDSADPTSPKVVRASVGALFQVPWSVMSFADAQDYLSSFTDERPIFRLEKTATGQSLQALATAQRPIVIAGSEGNGIRLDIPGTSLTLQHEVALESLNVGHAVAITLHEFYKLKK